MTNEEIKQEADRLYQQIKDAENHLRVLRSQCKHEHTFEGNYSYRVGVSTPAEICSYCGELVKLHSSYINNFNTATTKT
jgi:hypothetical protein